MKTDALATLLPATKLAPILKRFGQPASSATSGSKADGADAKVDLLVNAHADPIATLVYGFLLWESNSAAATQALARFREECVDFNELRVCLPEEIVGMLGSRYPFAEERANRLRRSLNDLYRREHKVSLEHAAAMAKREQRTYIENLDGMVPFVAARVLLIHFGQPGVPVDEQLAEVFREQKLVAKEASTTDIALALTKQYTAVDEALKVHRALVGFADSCWEKDPKAMMKSKSARIAAQQAAERAARKEAEKAAAEAARAAEAAARAEAERIEAAKAAARAQARAEARARAAAAKAAQREAAQREAAVQAALAAQAAKALAKSAPKAPAKLPTKPAAAKTPAPGQKPAGKKPADKKQDPKRSEPKKAPPAKSQPKRPTAKVPSKAPAKVAAKSPAKSSKAKGGAGHASAKKGSAKKGAKK
ncbi:MAG: hypothetical protein JNL80_12995 [Phycisphaerae bacterium]|nr:hypothetical protein [Phycisphaerae bacterium]